MKLTIWLSNHIFDPPKEIYAVGKCEICRFWGDEKDTRIAKTCQLDDTRRSAGDHCLGWEPK